MRASKDAKTLSSGGSHNIERSDHPREDPALTNNDECELGELPEADQGSQLTNLSETETDDVAHSETNESVLSANENVHRPSEIDNRPLATGTGNVTNTPAIDSQMSFKEINPRVI